jgi:hypothetical protein
VKLQVSNVPSSQILEDFTNFGTAARLGYDQIEPTIHGLRSTASMLPNESGK